MNFSIIRRKAHDLFEEASFISHIKSASDYKKATAMMDELIEDYDDNRPLIEVLSTAIERWEDSHSEFAQFNQLVKQVDTAEAMLKLLMETHNLGVVDIPEIGSKSLVSKILHGERSLTRAHISALSKRFNISPSLFFSEFREQ